MAGILHAVASPSNSRAKAITMITVVSGWICTARAPKSGPSSRKGLRPQRSLNAPSTGDIEQLGDIEDRAQTARRSPARYGSAPLRPRHPELRYLTSRMAGGPARQPQQKAAEDADFQRRSIGVRNRSRRPRA